MGIASRTCRTGSELGCTTARTASRRAGSFMGSSCALRFAVACACSSSGGACTVLGIAANRRARQARRSAGDFVEPASSVMGPAEARDAAGASRAGRARLGLASGCSGAAPNRGALMGRASPVRMGYAEDGGACSSRCTVMVCACGRAGCASRRARRLSAAVERASSECGMVGAGARCRT